MNKSKLPKTDSVRRLAAFWDTHDVTDFEHELEEVDASVFIDRRGIHLPLDARYVKAIERMAQAQGVSPSELVRAWVLQGLTRQNEAERTRTPRKAGSSRRPRNGKAA